jgi:hypothetical protein
MFSDRNLSIEVMEDLLAINTVINESLLKVQERATAEEFAKYRNIISNVIVLSFQVLPELWRLHPEICPKEFLPLGDRAIKATRLRKSRNRKKSK